MTTTFFWLDHATLNLQAPKFSSIRNSICMDLLSKTDEEVNEDDTDRVHVVEIESKIDGDIVEAVMFDDEIVGSLGRPLMSSDLQNWVRLY